MLALALVAGSAGAAPASSQPTVETLMYHMQRDASVARNGRNYRSMVQVATLYYTCPKDYGVDEAKHKRYETALREDELALRRAFTDAHQRLTGKYPAAEVSKAVQENIDHQRDRSSVITTKAIKRRGCTTANLKKLEHYFENQRTAPKQPTQSQDH